MTDAVKSLRDHAIVIIYRGLTPQQCLETTRVLYDAGLRWFEVTMNSESPLESISRLRNRLPDDARIGAGTVTEPDQVAQVAGAGAGFVISPHLDEEVVARTKDAGLVSVPGAFTATEALRAVRAGADLVKIFPIRPVGADYIQQIRGPLPDLPIVATGGVDAELARQCFAQGVTAVGVGAHLLGAEAIAAGDGAELTRQAHALLAAKKARPQ